MSWQTDREMTPTQFKKIIGALGMKQGAAGRFLGVSPRTSHRYATGDAAVPISTALLLRAMVYHGEEPRVPRAAKRAG